jgi:haloalkane dehalogenase
MKKVTRHYLTIGGASNGRLVHYRRSGKGPVLLMVHQSPRSSAEYEALMHEWGENFTCIAPDTPGFGQSEPLSKTDPDINDYADAVVEFAQALGLERAAAYGFHSGGIILVTALKRHPEFFSGLAVGGYAIWTPEETAMFADTYLPPFRPSAYGEHLTWLWNRVLEQSWFFPWFDVRREARLSVAHDDLARVHAVVMDMLDAGDAYRLGYGAVLRAPSDIPPPEAVTPPVLITAYDGDPLQAHIDRLDAMPAGWSARKVATPKEHQVTSSEFLRGLPHEPCPPLCEDPHQGFLSVVTDAFDGMIHWHGKRGAGTVTLHAPGEELDMTAELAIDVPGHGLSDRWSNEAPSCWPLWQAVVADAQRQLGATRSAIPVAPAGNPSRLYPELSPDRFGAYLTTAWSVVRAQRLFAPWYEANSIDAIDFDQSNLTPQALARDHRAFIRGNAAAAYHQALLEKEGNQNGNS